MITSTLTVESLRNNGMEHEIEMPVYNNSAKVVVSLSPVDNETMLYRERLIGGIGEDRTVIELKRKELPTEHAVNQINHWHATMS